MTRSVKTQKNSTQSKYPLLLSSALVKPMMTIATMAALTMASSASAQAAPDVYADWDDMSIVAGSADVTDTGLGSTLIEQHSMTAIGEAQELHIGSLGSVHIAQSGANALFVARAIGNHSDSSQILGALSATGQVMLLDRNGIIFGQDAQIDVGGLMASTGDLTNTDIMDGDGRFEFSNFGDGSIINNATLNIADAGVAAFVSPFVTNNGVIKAKVGTVAFAAGDKVTLDLHGDGLVEIAVEGQTAKALLENKGTIEAGIVHVEANAARGVVDSVINMEGITVASTVSESGGKIVLGGGSAGKVSVSGTLKASRSKKGNGGTGGSIEITGQDIEIAESGRVWANGDDDTQGGDIRIIADRRLDVAGRLRAKGIGGAVETSGGTLNIADTTDVSASLWTLDPLSILIADSAYLGNYSYINAGVLSAALTGGTSVLVQTGSVPTGSGHDHGDIRVGSMIENNGGSASISFESLRDFIIESGAGIGGTGTTEVNVDAGRNITLNGSIETNGADMTLKGNGHTRVYDLLSAASGDIYFEGSHVKFFDGSTITADAIDFTTNSVAQESLSAMSARVLTGSVQRKGSLFSDLNSFDEIGDFSTGLDAVAAGGLEIYDNSGSLLITGLVDSDRGAVRFGHEGSIWSEEIKLTNSGKIQTSNGAVNLNSTSRVIIHGDIDAGNGAVSAGATTVQFWNGSEVLARSIAFDASSVRQDAGSKIDAQRVGGSVQTTFDLDSILNEIDIIDGIATGTAGWHDGGLDLYSKNFLQINGPVSTTGGAINITSEARIDVKDGAFMSAVDGNIFLGAATVNLWENLATTGTVSGTASLVHVRDDAAEIQDAVDLSVSGALVTVAVGDYNEDITINAKNIDLRGARSGIDARGRVGAESTIYGGIIIENVTDGSVKGFAITGGKKGVWAKDANSLVIANNIITNVNDTSGYDDDGIFLDNAQDTLITKNVINNSGDDGIHVRNNVDGLIISQNNIGKASGDSVDLHLTTGNIRVNNNTISGGSAIGVHAKSTEGVVIAQNVISGARNEGIKITTGSTNAFVSNNTVTGGTNGIEVNGGTGHRVVTNTLNNSGDVALVAQNTAGVILNSNNINASGNDAIEVSSSAQARILNNIITAAGGEGIDVNNSAQTRIVGNQINGAVSNGISINPSPSSVITGNTVNGAGANGIDVSGSDSTLVKNNNVTGSTQSGIAVSGSSDVNVEENLVLLSGAHGISVSGGTDNSVFANIIALTGENGIFAENTSALTIEDNISGLALGDAIRVEGGLNSTITGNLVGLSYGDGIALDDASGTTMVSENKVLLVGGNGISSVNGAGTVNIDGNEVVFTGENGIYINGGRFVNITNNDIAYAGLGIYDWVDAFIAEGLGALFDADFSIRTPKLLPDAIALPWGAGDGIKVSGAGLVTVAANSVTLSGGDGIDVGYARSANIQNNTVLATGLDWTAYSFDDLFDHFATLDFIDEVLIPGEASILGEGNLTDFVLTLLPLPSDVKTDRRGGHGIYVHSILGTSISGNDVRHTANDGIKVSSAFGTTIRDNFVKRSGDDGIDVAGVDRVTVLENTVRSAGANGIEVTDAYTVDITDNKVKNTDDNGIKVADASWIKIVENKVVNAGDDGIDVDDVKSRRGLGWNVQILDNTVSNADDDGIDVADSRNVLINGNTVTNSDRSGLELSDLGVLVVSENNIYASGQEGIDGDDIWSAALRDNTIAGADSDGIELDDVKFVNINNNTISDVRSDGIDVDDSLTVSVVDNKIEDAGDHGIEIDRAVFAYIGDNRVKRSGDDGINLDKIRFATVASNRVSASAKDGIDADGIGELFVRNNIIKRSGDNGVEVTGGGFVRINRNEIKKSGENGVDVYGTDFVRVNRNDISKSDDNGIYVGNAENVRVKYNTIDDSGVNGIFVNAVNGAANVKWNTLSDSDEDGILVEEVNVARIIGNDVALSGDDGIDVAYAGFTRMKDNFITTSDDDGIDVDYVSRVRIIDNAVKSSGDNGITVYQSNDTNIIGNRIADSGEDGITASNINNRLNITDNVARRSGDDGIDAEYVFNANITDNEIRRSRGNGIELANAHQTSITGNDITRSREDGINVRNVYGSPFDYAVFIADNTLTITGDDGIEVVGAGRTRIESNTITDVGVTIDRGDFFGADAIHVRDVSNGHTFGLSQAFVSFDGPSRARPTFGDAVEIVGNTIDTTGDDGIQVLFSGDTVITDNVISNVGTASGARLFGADAISMTTSGVYNPYAYAFGQTYSADVSGNTITNVLGDGIEIDGANDVRVDGNTLSNIGDDGVRITGYNGYFPEFDDVAIDGGDTLGVRTLRRKPLPFGDAPEFNAVVSNNVITTVGGDGVETTNLNRAEIAGNDITGAAFNGYYASGPFSGDVIVSDNLFLNNDTGASFESGNIDLTGEGNGFVGGRIGMSFSPYAFSETTDRFGALSLAPRSLPTEGFADMSLVDNTIGRQLFNGQSSYFVELDNEAFFAPGSPTILNALNSTYFIPGEGFVTPSSTGGILSLDQFNFLESKFFHFTDDASLGLFFFGLVPGVDQEDIFRNIDGFDPEAFNVRLTILGLPRVALPAAGFDPTFLNQITPAAGGEDVAAGLNAIETAAGGAEETGCQSAAFSSAETGTAMTYSFGSSMGEASMDSAVDCL